MNNKQSKIEELEIVKKELGDLKIKYDNLKIEYDYLKVINDNLKNDIIVNNCMKTK